MLTYNQYTKLRLCIPFLSHKAFTIWWVICTLSTSPVAGVTSQFLQIYSFSFSTRLFEIIGLGGKEKPLVCTLSQG